MQPLWGRYMVNRLEKSLINNLLRNNLALSVQAEPNYMGKPKTIRKE